MVNRHNEQTTAVDVLKEIILDATVEPIPEVSGPDELDIDALMESQRRLRLLYALGRSVWERLGHRPCGRIHVWQGAAFEKSAEDEGEPALAPAAVEAREAILRHCPRPDFPVRRAADPRRPARSGQLVLDCLVVGPGEWWVGYHRARSVHSRWPGELIPLVRNSVPFHSQAPMPLVFS